MKLDILAFGAHPDDVELSCGGTIIKYIKEGKRVGIVDLTRGELGTQGNETIRDSESSVSQSILGVEKRINLDIGDGWFEINKENKLKVVRAIRRYKPTIILANAQDDRHPDHPRAAQLLKESLFLSGLKKIETIDNGVVQDIWRPKYLFHYIQYRYIKPDFVVDVSSHFETKMKAIMSFKSQFYEPGKESETLISSKKYLDFIRGRSHEMGSSIQVEHGEGFTTVVPLQIDLKNLL
ncbi:MAG: bacillithiol biosynthesis deacetylase BshB1 [Bacteroidia bacterium]|nr:bacillithiol biosynthesis deacetylase BshB1 [Bacteroidia bacterium]MDG2041727.1 bacillithiol biosynthesis deacetylase BshB1 [Bacteroidia bacterium]|tara:strand:- start:8056 stop:8766 length:711 start_codon:yes stop_codon:yes gene_type:complete